MLELISMSTKIIATNKKAGHDYHLMDHFEAGIALRGSEIKSIRARQISIKEAYVKTDGHQAWLINAHIAPYDPASRQNHNPRCMGRATFGDCCLACSLSFGTTPVAGTDLGRQLRQPMGLSACAPRTNRRSAVGNLSAPAPASPTCAAQEFHSVPERVCQAQAVSIGVFTYG